MGSQGCVLIKGCDEAEHRGFEEKLFTSPNGGADNSNDFPHRVVLSSFFWPGNGIQGIPDGKSDCALCEVNCKGCETVAKVDAFDDASVGYDKTYTRVHRDAAIVKAMQQWMGITV